MTTHGFSAEMGLFWQRAQADFDGELRRFLTTAPACMGYAPREIDSLQGATAYALGVDAQRSTGGKRIRPMLCLLTAARLGADYREAMPFALAIELMHNFTLVHDDIEDGDDVRRGRSAVWTRYGLPHGINIGDYMQNLALRALLDAGSAMSDALRVRLCALLTDTIDLTIRGQALDMDAAKNGARINREQYMEIVTLKTGYCLGAPLLAGAMVAGADAATLSVLQEIGLALGPLFQIKDDVIDLTADKGRGEGGAGGDIREGKRSFLVAVAFERASVADADTLGAILDKPRNETTAADVLWCKALFEQVGAFDEARTVCTQLGAAVRSAVAGGGGLPEPLSDGLSQIVGYLLEREV